MKIFQKEPWILNKGKQNVTIEKNLDNKGFFYVQKNEERRLSLNHLQIKSTYNHLIQFGYKLQNKVYRIFFDVFSLEFYLNNKIRVLKK